MAKRGPKSGVTDSQIAQRITQGKNDSEIARLLHVDNKRVARVRKLSNPLNSLTITTPLDTIKAVVRLELNQEECRNEFSDQLNEYTQNYKDAMGGAHPDIDAAGKWSILRVQLLKEMVKISGLDRLPDAPKPLPSTDLSLTPYAEVEARVRAIIAKRN